MRNVSLYEALQQYCKTALSLLKAKIMGPEDLPTEVKEKFEFSEDGSFSVSHVPEPVWYMLVSKNEEALMQGDAYHAAVKDLHKDGEVAKHLNTLVGTNELRTRVETVFELDESGLRGIHLFGVIEKI